MWCIFGKSLTLEVVGYCNEVMNLPKNVERSLPRGIRNYDFGSVSLSRPDSERKNLHECLEKGSRASFAWWLCSSEKIVSGWRGDGQKKLGKEKSDIALHETNDLNHRDWSYIKQASGLTELKKKHRLFGNFSTKKRIYQKLHTRDCQEVDELRRISCKQADKVRHLELMN